MRSALVVEMLEMAGDRQEPWKSGGTERCSLTMCKATNTTDHVELAAMNAQMRHQNLGW